MPFHLGQSFCDYAFSVKQRIPAGKGARVHIDIIIVASVLVAGEVYFRVISPVFSVENEFVVVVVSRHESDCDFGLVRLDEDAFFGPVIPGAPQLEQFGLFSELRRHWDFNFDLLLERHFK